MGGASEYIVGMKEKKGSTNISRLHALLQEVGLVGSREQGLTISTLAGDGSSRRFWRVMVGSKEICLAVAPPCLDCKGLAEARAARSIGLHLLQQGVRVPEQYGWDEEQGILLFEDLGDEKLHDRVLHVQGGADWVEEVRSCYGDVVKGLVRMQVSGARGFDPGWCWEGPRYDRELMRTRESGYFLRAFWEGYLAQREPRGLQEEFDYVAAEASKIPSSYFLHRDFQSRNIMLSRGEVCFIDFQGGRLGPLGYDLASLLIDPYVGLPVAFQEELLGLYLECLEAHVAVDREQFVQGYGLLALQRNLQIVGAFAFLAKQRKKRFFAQFLQPAIASLDNMLAREQFADLPILRKVVAIALVSVADR